MAPWVESLPAMLTLLLRVSRLSVSLHSLQTSSWPATRVQNSVWSSALPWLLTRHTRPALSLLTVPTRYLSPARLQDLTAPMN